MMSNNQEDQNSGNEHIGSRKSKFMAQMNSPGNANQLR